MLAESTKLLEEYENREVCVESNPAVIYVESVKGCPFTCAMCKPEQTKAIRMSDELLENIEPYFKDLEVLAVHGFGEPLLGDLDYFVEQSIKHDFVLHMNTTGFFLTKKKIDSLLRTRLSIRFSIHSGTAETYRKIMGQDFDKVIQNISYLVKESESNGKSHDFWFSYIVMKDNVDEIDAFLRVAHECGIKHVRFMRLSPRPLDRKDLEMLDRDYVFNYAEQSDKQTQKKFVENMPRYEKLAKELDIKIEAGSLMNRYSKANSLFTLANKATAKILNKRYLPLLPRKGMCAAPWIGQLFINQKGDVRVCCRMSSRFTLGNINDSSLKEIWNSTKMKEMRRSFKEGRIPHVCGYCNGFDLSEYPNNTLFREDQP